MMHKAHHGGPVPVRTKAVPCQVDSPSTCIARLTVEGIIWKMVWEAPGGRIFLPGFPGNTDQGVPGNPQCGDRLRLNGVWTCDDGGQLPEADYRRLRRRALAHCHRQ